MKIILQIEVDREQQIAIEEYCINTGISISQYFIDLHNTFFELKNEEPLKLSEFMEEPKKIIEDNIEEDPKKENREETKRKKSGK